MGSLAIVSPTQLEVIADRYELTGEILASGGMGRVLGGRDRVLDRPVAIKLLASGLGDAPGARKRFRLEAVNTARLSHPNVVAVFDAGEHRGHAYIVMERLPGRTLAEELSAGPIPTERAIELVTQVLAALRAAHDAGIVHRDVKPGNVLLAGDGSARLSDFGIAKLLEHDATRTRDLLGTPAYVAPELLEGRPASAQSDVYAAGIILFEALAGRKPFAGEPSLAHLAAAQSGKLPSLRDVAPWIEPRLIDIVDRAIARNPVDRFASANEMIGALAHTPATSAAPDATAVLPAPDSSDDTLSIRRRPAEDPPPRTIPRWALLAAAIAVATGGIAVLASVDSPKASSPPPARSTATTASIPQPLASALSQLDEAVSGR